MNKEDLLQSPFMICLSWVILWGGHEDDDDDDNGNTLGDDDDSDDHKCYYDS